MEISSAVFCLGFILSSGFSFPVKEEKTDVADRGIFTDFIVPMGNTLRSAAENTFGAAMEVVGIVPPSEESVFGKVIANNTKNYLDSFGLLPETLTNRLAKVAEVVPNRIVQVSKDAAGEFFEPMNKYGVIESLAGSFAAGLLGR
ncbi:hypothetical protein L9F63_027175 [Diploptera punctata]|uniref:Uncharacterized protein n=1 Tax=Diploptera punctata TaxID=6984 RepID=A0AAD8EMI0_DIPPU|nr:hypothetical protein L9F63_027175 [Diploptera punctata]